MAARDRASRVSKWWDNQPLRFKALLAGVLPVAALGVAVLASVLALLAATEAQRWVRHSYEVQIQIQRVNNQALQAVAAVRAYRAAGDAHLLEPYLAARRELPPALARLQALVAGDREESRNAGQVAAAIERQQPLLEERLEQYASDQTRPSAAVTRDLSLRGAVAAVDLRRWISEMQAAEDRLTDRTGREGDAQRRVLLVLASSLGLGVVGGLVTTLLFTAGIARRIAALSENARRLARGQPLLSSPPTRDEIGKLETELVGSATLLAARNRELRQARGFLEHLILASPGVILRASSPDFAVTYASPNIERVLGFAPSEILGDTGFWIRQVHPEDRAGLLAGVRPEADLDYRFQHKDGRHRWLRTTLSADPDLPGRGVLAYALDITERKLAEEKLARSNQELNDFGHIVSHDLKEPLRGIHNYSQFLLEDYGAKLDAEAQSKLQTVAQLAHRMESLIDALLNFSRVGRVEMAVQKTYLNTVLSDVVDSLRFTLDESGVELRIPRPLPPVRCDRVPVRELFYNLILNAAKYNDKPAKWVEVGWAPGPVLYVRDNGIGIPEQHFDRVFQMFKRLHGRDQYGGGTGAGLSVAKKIVERHGGRIWIESQCGQGTTFHFTLQEGV